MIPVSISATHAVQVSVETGFLSPPGALAGKGWRGDFATFLPTSTIDYDGGTYPFVGNPQDANDCVVITNFSEQGDLVLAAWVENSAGFTYGWWKSNAWTTSHFGLILSAAGRRIRMAKGRNAIVISSLATPYIHGYKFSTSGHGTKFSNPATLPPFTAGAAAGAFGLAISHTDQSVVIGGTASGQNQVQCYDFSSSTGFGTIKAVTWTSPGANVQNIDFSPNGQYVAMSADGSPFIFAYPYTDANGLGTKVSNPATLPSGSPTFGESVKFSPDGSTVALTTNASPWIHAWAWTGTSFGTKYSNPSPVPTALTAGQNLAWTASSGAILLNNNVVLRFTPGVGFGTGTGWGLSTTGPAIAYKPWTKL